MQTIEQLEEQYALETEARILVYRLDIVKIDQDLKTAKPKEVSALLRRKAFAEERIDYLKIQQNHFSPFN